MKRKKKALLMTFLIEAGLTPRTKLGSPARLLGSEGLVAIFQGPTEKINSADPWIMEGQLFAA